MRYGQHIALAALVIAGALASGCERPPQVEIQRGYRGLAMDLLYNPRLLARQEAANLQAPALAPPAPPAGGPPATSIYKNIQVLTDLNVAQLAQLMVAMTTWVAPANQSCSYCHTANMASDDNYHKVVARQMLRMVRHLNAGWHTHVGAIGVTCYTCHRGNDVPTYVWYLQPGPSHSINFSGGLGNKNAPALNVGLTALPSDVFRQYLDDVPTNVRVVATTALPGEDRSSIKQAEETYGLMMHMTQALGVNCTFCHNTRSFTSWATSTPQRATAWYGIRMVRDINAHYLEPITPLFPASRKGPLNDVAKVNCETCHQGVYAPLFGASMLSSYPGLTEPAHSAAPASAPPGPGGPGPGTPGGP